VCKPWQSAGTWKVDKDNGDIAILEEKVTYKVVGIALPLFCESYFPCFGAFQELWDELQFALEQEKRRLSNDSSVGAPCPSKTVGARCFAWSKTTNEYCWGTITRPDGNGERCMVSYLGAKWSMLMSVSLQGAT
jgi:hypothetical protein